MGLFPTGFGGRFWCLVAATLLGFLGVGTVLPAMAPHVRHDLGGSDQTVGFVIGIFSFMALASRFVSGRLADRRGRKIAFIAGLSSCALAGITYLLPVGIPGLYLGRVLQGFGEACLYTGAAAWAVEVAGIHRSGQALGYISTGIWGGISAGPVVGEWLGTFQRAAMMQTAAALVGIAVLLAVHEEYKPNPHTASRRWFPPGLLAPGLTIGFVNVHYPVFTGFLILHLAKHGNAGPAAFSAYAIVILVSRFFLGGLPDRIHPAITFYGGLVSMAVGLIVIAAGPPPVLAVAAAATLGFGLSFPWSAVGATVLKRAAVNERASSLGILTASYDLFVGVSSFAAGAVATRFGYGTAFLGAAGALLLAAISGWVVFFGRRSEPLLDVAEPALLREFGE